RTARGFRHIPSPFLAVAAGCYSPCVLHRQAGFWDTGNTTGDQLFRQRECPDPIPAVSAAPLQTLAQPPLGAALSFLPQLLRLCTGRGHALRSMAWLPAPGLAPAALPAAVCGRRGSGARALPVPPLPCTRRPSRALRRMVHRSAAEAARHTLAGIGHCIMRMQAFLVFHAHVEVGQAFVGVERELDAPGCVLAE